MSYNRTNINTLDQVCEVIDSLHKSPKYVESGYPMIRVKDMFQGYLKIDNPAYVTKEVYEEFTRKHKPKKGDILFSRVGSYGITTFVHKDIDFCLGQNTVVMTNYNNEIIDNIFLYYMLISNIVKEQIEKLVTGSTQKTISMKSIKSLELPLPNIAEQKAIADILSALDDKIELNHQMNETLEEMAQALFKRWFVDFEFPNEEGHPYKSSGGEMIESELGMIPKGWHVGILSDYADVEKGLSYKGKHLVEDGVPMINLGSVNPGGGYRKEKIKYYNGDFKEKHIVKPGDIIIANTDMTQDRVILGSPIIVPDFGVEKIIFTHHLFAFKRVNIAKEYLYYYLKSNNFRERAESYATGTTVLAISKKAVLDIPFILPTKDIIENFVNIIKNYIEIINLNNNQITYLEEIRDTLLPKLMSGEIRVSDLEG